MRHGIANAITGSRILLSLVLLFTRTLSPAFTVVYLLAGLTDMLDGFAARRTGASSAFGAKLDTAADLCFFAAAAYKLFPVIRLPLWIWIWTGAIAVLKAYTMISGVLVRGEFPAVHSFANKAAGLFLYLFPCSIPYLNPAYSASLLCVIATFAAVQESCAIRKG